MRLYEPINTLKPIAENLWVVDGTTINFYGLPFTTRMVVVRLNNNDLFVHSPVAITDDLKKQVATLGQVKHLVSPNWIHYAYITQWQAAFPDTVAWASPGVEKRAAKKKVCIAFDKNIEDEADPPWSTDMDHLIVRGNPYHTEVVFFQRASKTLIVTDLIENFEANRIAFWWQPLARMGGILHPDGKAPLDIRMTFRSRDLLRQSVEKMISWEPERVILAHGKWYETNAVDELRRAFRWVL